MPTTTLAETHIYGDTIKTNMSWNKEGSPYILEEPIYIPSGYQLTINKGVEVISTTTENDPNSITVEGNLQIVGSITDPVKFTNLYSLYFTNSTSYIEHAIFDHTGLDFTRSTSTIQYSTIQNSFNAINTQGSHIDISTSSLVSNSFGISSYLYQKFHQVFAPPNTGGIGNALDGVDIDPEQNIITIHNSSIISNSNFGIINQTGNFVDARDNWWGRIDGPTATEKFGLVSFEPWKEFDPTLPMNMTCCSNVLFFPGFEGSRLYLQEAGILGTTTNKLWEPLSNNDVKKMYMDKKGVSLNQTIETKDIIDTVPFVGNIYKSFMDSMDGLVAKGLINNWTSIPYDWRKGVSDLVDDSLIEKVKKLASDSKTGKAIIVAHSNGGLVAKLLIKKLEELGLNNLIENSIYVTVPELGTPDAIISMLHGYGRDLGASLVLSSDNARIFSQNMPGAYSLLPTRNFFEKNQYPVISNMFNSSTTISTFDTMRDFLLNNSFSKLTTHLTNIPLKLNEYLFNRSDDFHSAIDIWKSDSTSHSLSIFGWGIPTIQAIVYKPDIHCTEVDIKKCPISFSPVTDDRGDGTVVAQSDSRQSDQDLFFNLKRFNKDTARNITHADVLESNAILSKIKDVILHKVATSSDYDSYFSKTEPVDNDLSLTVRVYSPVDLDVYDKNGKHAGAIYIPSYDKWIPDFQNMIPGGYYMDYGTVKIITVPYEKDDQIVLSGNAPGVFAVETEISQHDHVIASSTFADIPVTPLMNAELAIGSIDTSFATTTSITIDADGDGTFDLVEHSNEFLHSTTTDAIKDLPTYLEAMKKMIISLKLPLLAEKNWLNRIDRISRSLDKKNIHKVEIILKKITSKRFKNKKIDETDKKAILLMFEQLLSALEKKN